MIQALEKELVGQEKKYEAIKECAKDLIDNYLDEPLETQKEVDELVALWDEVRALAASKQERLKGALKVSVTSIRGCMGKVNDCTTLLQGCQVLPVTV